MTGKIVEIGGKKVIDRGLGVKSKKRTEVVRNIIVWKKVFKALDGIEDKRKILKIKNEK